jgi:hypothetical protein
MSYQKGVLLIVVLLAAGLGSARELDGPKGFCENRRPASQSQRECEAAQWEAIRIIRESYGPGLGIEEGSPEAELLDGCLDLASDGQWTDQVALLQCLEGAFGPR